MLKEILDQWNKVQATVESKVKDDTDIDTKLAKLLENQKIATIVQRVYTEDELRIKQQILEQYSQLSGDEEYDEDEDGATTSASASDGLTKNTNAHDVAQLVKERREQAKADSQSKKLKDKEDREKQKQNKIDKKESRKTVKGEKRR